MQIRLESIHRQPEVGRPPEVASVVRRGTIPDGDDVEVRNRFENHWVNGFAVAESGEGGYRLRRLSDGRVLPTWFPHDVVRRRR